MKKEIRHGTRYAYDKRKCRCDKCTKAKNDYKRKLYGRNPKKVTTNVEKGTRICYSCGIDKSLNDFCKNRNRRAFMGYGHECKKCHNERSKRNKNKPNARYSTYKSGARVRDIPFNLTFEEFETFWNRPCYYCSNEIDGIGLDRVDSKGDYSVKNVVSCCSRCNYAKSRLTENEFISMCKKVAKKFK